jgi:acyl-CoA hydrolase
MGQTYVGAGTSGAMPDLVDTYIENRWLVQPNHANSLGSTHGGNVLKWMDELGAMSAMRFAGENCATVSIDGVEFKRPIPVGETAVIEAYVYAAGRTSVRVRLRAARENPRTGEQKPTTESYAVYVAIDEDREPTPVPDLTVDSERGERLRDEALDNEERNGNGDRGD